MSSNNSDRVSDIEEESLAASEVLERLEVTWINEKFAPDLLDHQMEIVDCMLEQIDEQETNLDAVQQHRNRRKGDLRISLHTLEGWWSGATNPRSLTWEDITFYNKIDRIRFIISSYLRIRLKKIEKFSGYILDNTEQLEKLSSQELIYAKEFNKNLIDHIKEVAINEFPANLKVITDKEMNTEPSMDNYIFLRMVNTVNDVLVERETEETSEEIIDLQKDHQHLMRYEPISKIVNNGDAVLI